MMTHDDDDDNPIKFVIKDNNAYKCVRTKWLKFLDIKYYLAPGFSYSKYLAAYNVPEGKGFFPYEYVRDLSQLEEPTLPPKRAFYSQLRKQGITEEDYAFCQRVWREEGMSSLKDFLVWYNNLDVVPFLAALEKQVQFYQGLGLDMLKDALGIPGLTLRYLFKGVPRGVYFSLINKKHRDLHELLRQQIVGGPSLIFHRYHEAGVTRIRKGTKPVASVIGLDANALYLHALTQDMPTGLPIRRRKESGFRPEYLDKYGRLAHEWLEFVAQRHNITIRHKFNDREKALGNRQIRVDGWCASTSTAYQFHGCLFHGHACRLTEGLTHNPVTGKSLECSKTQTERITSYLKNEVGVNVIEMRECEWLSVKKDDLEAHRVAQNLAMGTQSCLGPNPDQEEILEGVTSGSWFGLVQCDISVPKRLQERFSEMQPIFKNAPVSREDIGPFMAQYARQNNLLTQPRRMLIGSFVGEGVLIITPLLRWYLKHGLEVTNVQQVIEYAPNPCFQEFGTTVSDARRSGDSDPKKAILADSFKLLGNCGYGCTLTNVEKHRDQHYVSPTEAQALIASPLFKKLTPWDEEVQEVETAKKSVVWSLPLQIGFFVYQYAKLRMLEMHYDLVDRFIDRSDYQLCEMDTDSLYLALSKDSLEACVPKEKKSLLQSLPPLVPNSGLQKTQGRVCANQSGRRTLAGRCPLL